MCQVRDTVTLGSKDLVIMNYNKTPFIAPHTLTLCIHSRLYIKGFKIQGFIPSSGLRTGLWALWGAKAKSRQTHNVRALIIRIGFGELLVVLVV